MNIIAQIYFSRLLVAGALIFIATVSRAETLENKTDKAEGHTAKIVRNTEARVDHLAEKLKFRAQKVVQKTEARADKVVTRVKEAGQKADATFKKTADKVGAKLEKLSE